MIYEELVANHERKLMHHETLNQSGNNVFKQTIHSYNINFNGLGYRKC